MKKTEFNGSVYYFSVDYDATDDDNILGIHKFLMKKMALGSKMFGFVKNMFFAGLTILSSFTRVNSLSCISMSNQ